jgi:hypothetical protein
MKNIDERTFCQAEQDWLEERNSICAFLGPREDVSCSVTVSYFGPSLKPMI